MIEWLALAAALFEAFVFWFVTLCWYSI
jgi:hypothetical protein